MIKNLQSRKRQLVQDAIYDAAIDLFARKGFDETTVEQIAESAGVSRRSFFRYFETKDDLLAINTIHCGECLVAAAKACPASFGPLDVLREAVLAGARFSEAQRHTRQIVEISERSVSSRQAHLSRLMEVQENLSLVYMSRLKGVSPYQLKPLLFAGTTLQILNGATVAWYKGEHKTIETAAKQGLLHLAHLFSNESFVWTDVKNPENGKKLAFKAPKKSRGRPK